MKLPVKKLTLILIPVVLLSQLLSHSTEESDRNNDICLKHVRIKAKTQWMTLEDIVRIAHSYVSAKTHISSNDLASFTVWIDQSETNLLAQVTFGQGIGHNSWEVSINSEGKALGVTERFAIDSHSVK